MTGKKRISFENIPRTVVILLITMGNEQLFIVYQLLVDVFHDTTTNNVISI